MNQSSEQVGGQVGGQDIIQENDRTDEILELCKIPRSRNEIQCFLKIKSRSYVREKLLNPLIKGGLLKLIIPDKPTSSNQKYYSEKNIKGPEKLKTEEQFRRLPMKGIFRDS